MTIECEIAALRLWAVSGAIAIHSKERATLLTQAVEQRLRDWLHQKRAAELAACAAFNQVDVSAAVDSLTLNWPRYNVVSFTPDDFGETLNQLLAIFWGRCLIGYTNKTVEDFIRKGESTIDLFAPTYLRAQLLMANAAVSKTPELSGKSLA